MAGKNVRQIIAERWQLDSRSTTKKERLHRQKTVPQYEIVQMGKVGNGGVNNWSTHHLRLDGTLKSGSSESIFCHKMV
jgi:outer membrane receptor for monomeric catechols